MAQKLTDNLKRAGWDKELLNHYESGDYRKLAISLVKKSFEKGESPDTRADGMFGPFAMDDVRGQNQVKGAIRRLRDESKKTPHTLAKYVKSLKEESLNEDFDSFEIDEESDDPDLDEVLSPAQRMKKRAQFRKNRSKIKRGQERAKRRRPDKETVDKRAKRQARTQVKKNVSGGKNPSDLTPTQRASVEKRAQGRSSQIDRLTRRLKPKVRQKAREALEYKASTTSYDFETIAEVFIRGFDAYSEEENSHLTAEQYAFARVNSFLTNGYAAKLDEDLIIERSEGGPPDEGTDASTKYAKKKIPGQNVQTNTKGDSKPEVKFSKEDFNAVSAFKQSKGKQFDLYGTIKKAVRNTSMAKEFEKTLQLYSNMVKQQPNKDRMQLAVKAANEIGMITPREFTTFLKKEIKKGSLPQELSVT